MRTSEDNPPNTPPRPGSYAYTKTEDDDEGEATTPTDDRHRSTPSARPAMSQAEANLMMIEQALISLKEAKRMPDPQAIEALEKLVKDVRKEVAKGKP